MEKQTAFVLYTNETVTIFGEQYDSEPVAILSEGVFSDYQDAADRADMIRDDYGNKILIRSVPFWNAS